MNEKTKREKTIRKTNKRRKMKTNKQDERQG